MANGNKRRNNMMDFIRPCSEEACTGWRAVARGQFRCFVKNALLVLVLLLVWSLVAHAGTHRVYHRVAGGNLQYAVQAGDTLGGIARRFGEPRLALALQNHLDPSSYAAQIYVGQALSVDNRHIVPDERVDGIVINLAQRRLYRFQSGRLTDDVPIAAGATDPKWQTPIGDFTIKNAEQNPTWFVPRSIQNEMRRNGKPVIDKVPPGPGNPLGKYWIGLSLPGIGIHGTISPDSIYNFESHGCMRLGDADIRKLFSEVRPGDRGKVMYAPVLLAESGGRIYLEVHRDPYGKGEQPLAEVQALAQDRQLTGQIDWQKAMQVIEERDGVAEDVSKTAV